MKRVWFAAAFLCAIAALCIWANFKTAQCTNELRQSLTQTLDAARSGDYALAAKYAAQAEENWQRHSTVLGALLRHDESDSIELSLAALGEYVRARELNEICAHCAELLQQAEHIRQMEFPYLKNIL